MLWLLSILSTVFIVCSVEVLQKTGERKLTFKPPALTEEDTNSRFIPETFKCDACKAIAYQFFTKFDQFNLKNKKYNYEIPESELLDLIENVCKRETFDQYGVKDVDGQKRLSGVGLETKDKPGLLAGGGMWPSRLSIWCSSIVGELSEDEIYTAYKEQPDDLFHFQNYLCFQNGVRGSCRKNSKEDL